MENKVRKVSNAIAALLNEIPRDVPAAPTSPNYSVYLKENMPDHKRLRALRNRMDERGPLFSLLLFIEGEDAFPFTTVLSVLAQTYTDWELIVADKTDRENRSSIVHDKRIKYVSGEGSHEIAEKMLKGDYVIRLYPDDRLEADALHLFADIAINESADMIYADHDVHDEHGKRLSPFFKPSFSPVTEIAFDYIARPTAVKRKLHIKAGGFDRNNVHGYNINCILKAKIVRNISRIILSVKDKPNENFIKDYKIDRNLRAYQGMFYCSCRVMPNVFKRTSVTVVIGDAYDANCLRTSLESLDGISVLYNLRIIIVKGPDMSDTTLKYLDALKRNRAARIVSAGTVSTVPETLNFGASCSFSKYLVFMSASVKTVKPDSLFELIVPLMMKNVAVSGGKLISSDGTLYNTGFVTGLGGSYASPYEGTPDDKEDLKKCFYTAAQRNVSAVSGLFMAVKSNDFMNLGMLDETLSDTGWDVEFCLRAIKAGKQVVYTPFAEAELLKDHPVDNKTFGKEWSDGNKDLYLSPIYDLRFTDLQIKIRS